MAVSSTRVQHLYTYPVKSCKPIELRSAAVLPTGLPYDRTWMIVRTDTGKSVTQRQEPRLALIATALPPEALLGGGGADAWGKLGPDAALTLSAPGMAAPLAVPLAPAAAAAAPPLRTVSVWEWTGPAADEGDDAAAWLSRFLGQEVRLVRHLTSGAPGAGAAALPPGALRATDADFAAGHTVRFADGFPILLARRENLEDLNARISAAGGGGGAGDDQGGAASAAKALPMARFRPNVVLGGGGAPAWADDLWAGVTIGGGGGGGDGGGAVLRFVKPCSRCKVTTIDQDAGVEAGGEPLDTLRTFRTGRLLGWAEQHKIFTHAVMFAWNAVLEHRGAAGGAAPLPVIAVGDEVVPTPR